MIFAAMIGASTPSPVPASQDENKTIRELERDRRIGGHPGPKRTSCRSKLPTNSTIEGIHVAHRSIRFRPRLDNPDGEDCRLLTDSAAELWGKMESENPAAASKIVSGSI
jgi:hypothetical protein